MTPRLTWCGASASGRRHVFDGEGGRHEPPAGYGERDVTAATASAGTPVRYRGGRDPPRAVRGGADRRCATDTRAGAGGRAQESRRVQVSPGEGEQSHHAVLLAVRGLPRR